MIYEKEIKPGCILKYSGKHFSYVAKVLEKHLEANRFVIRVLIISSIRDPQNERPSGEEYTLYFYNGINEKEWKVMSKLDAGYPKCSKCSEG